MSPEKCRLYENPSLREMGSGLIRPGGLELTQKTVDLSALPPGARLLDIGCGTGAALRYLIDDRGFRAVGIDPSMVLLAEGLRKNPGLPLAGAAGTLLPFATGSMDAVLAECSLSVISDVTKALDECFRVLEDNGLLLVHDIYARNPSGAAGLPGLPLKSCLTGAVSKEEWIERFHGCGFTLLHWEDHSRSLKEFAARLIFEHGSLETFWGCSTGGPAQGGTIQSALHSAKPGYFLAVARKTGSPVLQGS
jgi:ubiquinone/menaquinone biosynthesis C-methylase UbiE